MMPRQEREALCLELTAVKEIVVSTLFTVGQEFNVGVEEAEAMSREIDRVEGAIEAAIAVIGAIG